MRPVRSRFAPRGWIPLALTCALYGATSSALADESSSAQAMSLDVPQLHSDVKFSLVAPARKEPTNRLEVDLYWQTTRVSAALQTAARSLYPQPMEKIGGKFDVYLGDAGNPGSLSSASGRIVLTTGFAELQPADGWLALVIAREMGHVLAGHHDRNAVVSMLTSAVLNLLIPGGAIIKQVLSFGGSQMASSSGRSQQIREADEIALKLLEAAGYSSTSLALNMALGPTHEQLGTGSWASDFSESADRIIAKARDMHTAAAKLADAPAARSPEPTSPPEFALALQR